jgi:asparagine synthase (glutamine-hydrolysing)
MSVQFGRWNFDGRPVPPDDLERVNAVLAPYAPDGRRSFSDESVTILYRAFHTTKESGREAQPRNSRSDTVLTWDGRLDNGPELVHDLGHTVSSDPSDLLIVAAAYELWGTNMFARLIGDWALSIWNPNERSLILATDPIGARHLYYSLEPTGLTWSTVLDPLIHFAGRSFELNEEYIAGWLSFFPAPQITPFVGIHAVPPSCFIRVKDGKGSVTRYWDFDPGMQIRYRSDADYEEHFRFVFAEAVRRRLRSEKPIVAELSGGMDSSSIVCMADNLAARGQMAAPRLDTVSYYDDAEPNWDERPYFTKVEEKRGRPGCHIDVGAQSRAIREVYGVGFPATPASAGPVDQGFVTCIRSGPYRAMLSGIGGDEVTGGVPTPMPELEDLLAAARLRDLAYKLKVWALNKRTPWPYLLFEALRGFFPPALVGVPKFKQPPLWLDPLFVKHNLGALQGYAKRTELFAPRPSFQENLRALDSIRRQLACGVLPSDPSYEKRYPYLDRSLLEFLFAIPRDQLVRPGQRRSLMRRALQGIVPSEILDRRRKAYVTRAPQVAAAREWPCPNPKARQSHLASIGIIDDARFSQVIEAARQGKEVQLTPLMRTLALEIWVHRLTEAEIPTSGTTSCVRQSIDFRSLRIEELNGIRLQRS